MAQTAFQYNFLALFLPLAGRCWSGRWHRRAGGRRGRVDLLWWLGGRAGGHPAPRPRPAVRPSGRGKHMQSTWPDLELNSDSHNHTHTCTYTLKHVYSTGSAHVVRLGTDTWLHPCVHTCTHTQKLIQYVLLKYIYSSQTCMYICGCVYDTRSLYIICRIKTISVDYIQPETPTQMPSTQHSSLYGDVNVKPLWCCFPMSVLHLVKTDSAYAALESATFG